MREPRHGRRRPELTSELEFINHAKLIFAGTSDLCRKHLRTPHGSRLFHQLTDDRDRARPAPSLARVGTPQPGVGVIEPMRLGLGQCR